MIQVQARSGLSLRRWIGAAAVLTVALLAGSPARGQPAQGLPKAEDVLNKYVAATGGKEAYEKVKNSVARGTLELAGAGIKGTLTIYHAAPNKQYTEIDLPGLGKSEQGADGRVAWEKSTLQGARIKQGAERATALREAEFNAELKWQKLYKKGECVGLEMVDGKPAYKVVLTPAEGNPMTEFFDKDSGLMVKVVTRAQTPMGELDIEIYPSDYKRVDGLLIPHKLRQKVLTQEMDITLDKIELNVEIPKGRFDLPEDIKKLAEKEKGSKDK